MDGGVVSFRMYHQFYVFGEDQNYRLQVANPGSGSLGTSNHLLKLTVSNYCHLSIVKNTPYFLFFLCLSCNNKFKLYMNVDNYCYGNIKKEQKQSNK